LTSVGINAAGGGLVKKNIKVGPYKKKEIDSTDTKGGGSHSDVKKSPSVRLREIKQDNLKATQGRKKRIGMWGKQCLEESHGDVPKLPDTTLTLQNHQKPP